MTAWNEIVCAMRERLATQMANATREGVPIPGILPHTLAAASRHTVVGRPKLHSQRPNRMKIQDGAPKSASTKTRMTIARLNNQLPLIQIFR